MKYLLSAVCFSLLFVFFPPLVWANPDFPSLIHPAIEVFYLAQSETSGLTQSPSVEQNNQEGSPKVFQTKYTTIYYYEDKDIDDFIWRLGGQRLEIARDPKMASYRLDRLVERVQAILDMWPRNFKITINLHRKPLSANQVAYYEKNTGVIHISVDYTSDGVVAHEIAHANIEQYFPVAPASKMQEILTQYVDKNLWSDY